MTTSATINSPCRRTTLALPWLLNGSLEPAERREVREHLIHCPACRAELARTRETLALFRNGEQRASEESRAILAPASRRAAFGQAGVRRLAWAAMIASVLASTGWIWLAARRTERSETADRRPVQRRAEARTQGQTAGGPEMTPGPTVESPAPIRLAAKPRHNRRAQDKAHTLAAPAPAPPTSSQVIFTTGFESGSIASLETTPPPSSSQAPLPSRISAAGFESGDLGEWN